MFPKNWDELKQPPRMVGHCRIGRGYRRFERRCRTGITAEFAVEFDRNGIELLESVQIARRRTPEMDDLGTPAPAHSLRQHPVPDANRQIYGLGHLVSWCDNPTEGAG